MIHYEGQEQRIRLPRSVLPSEFNGLGIRWVREKLGSCNFEGEVAVGLGRHKLHLWFTLESGTGTASQ